MWGAGDDVGHRERSTVARKDVSNYILSLQHHDALTWEEAVNTVVSRTCARAADFLDYERDLEELLTRTTLTPEEHDGVWGNVAGMRIG